jgi:hypothetical protein
MYPLKCCRICRTALVKDKERRVNIESVHTETIAKASMVVRLRVQNNGCYTLLLDDGLGCGKVWREEHRHVVLTEKLSKPNPTIRVGLDDEHCA